MKKQQKIYMHSLPYGWKKKGGKGQGGWMHKVHRAYQHGKNFIFVIKIKIAMNKYVHVLEWTCFLQ